MIGSQFPAYFDMGAGGMVVIPTIPQFTARPIERRIADVLRIRTNTIAGRPNVGNLAYEFIQKGRSLPSSVLRDYLLRTLRSFIPGVRFEVQVDDQVDASGFQHFVVGYTVL